MSRRWRYLFVAAWFYLVDNDVNDDDDDYDEETKHTFQIIKNVLSGQSRQQRSRKKHLSYNCNQ